MSEKIEIDAFLLAAGRGNRLRPITDTLPKPLICVGGKELIAWNLELLARSGFSRVIINVCHLAGQIKRFVGDGSAWGLAIELVEEDHLLDSGGSIKNIESYLLGKHLLTINSDILLGKGFTLNNLVDAHTSDSRRPLATMLLRPDIDAEKYGAIGLEEDGKICSFLDYFSHKNSHSSKPNGCKRLMFTGVQVISKELIETMPPRGTIFSVTRDTLRGELARGKFLKGVNYGGYWNDIGTPERLEQASKDIG